MADALKAQRAALLAGTADPRAELQSLVAGTQFDRARPRRFEAKTGAVRDKSPAVVTALADFYDSLKPEQQQKVREGWPASPLRLAQLTRARRCRPRPRRPHARHRPVGGL